MARTPGWFSRFAALGAVVAGLSGPSAASRARKRDPGPRARASLQSRFALTLHRWSISSAGKGPGTGAGGSSHCPRDRARISVLGGVCTIYRGRAVAEQGQRAEGIAQMRQGMAACEPRV